MPQLQRHDVRNHERNEGDLFARLGVGVLASGIATVGGWLIYSALGIDHHVGLLQAIDATQERFVGPMSHFLNVYVDRHDPPSTPGRPLVLVHSINAAASAYEMKPIFEHYRGQRPVYALDLPGFGFSERANRAYSPALYKEAILDLLRFKVKEPADVVALSLGSEFAAMAAQERADLVHSLTLISPSGFTDRRNREVSPRGRDQGTSDLTYGLLAFPLWSQGFYDLLTTRRAIRFFLEKSFVGPVDAGLEQYAYASSHQPGAKFAPLQFVSGRLFTSDVRETVYERLTVPVLVLYDRDFYVRFDTLPGVVERHSNWRAARIEPTYGMPQFEQLNAVTQALDNFWATIPV